MSQVNEWFTVFLGKSRWAGIEALFSIHTFNTAVTARLQHKSPSKQEKLTVNNIDIVPAKFVFDLVNHKLLCNIPLMSNLDPVYQLVLSQGHLEPLVTLKGYHQIHFGIDNTYYNVVRGTFPIYSANLKNNIIN